MGGAPSIGNAEGGGGINLLCLARHRHVCHGLAATGKRARKGPNIPQPPDASNR